MKLVATTKTKAEPHDTDLLLAEEVVPALRCAMLRLPGIEDVQGHSSKRSNGTGSICLWFNVSRFGGRGLLTLARLTCPRYFPMGQHLSVKLYHGDTDATQVSYVLEGALTKGAIDAARDLARIIDEHVDDTFVDGYNILHGYAGALGIGCRCESPDARRNGARKKPWLAIVFGDVLCTPKGIPRRFATAEKATRAARAAATPSRVASRLHPTSSVLG